MEPQPPIRARTVTKDGRTQGVGIFCPACKCAHIVNIDGGDIVTNQAGDHDQWTWNGSKTLPTFAPSILIYGNGKEGRCHSHVVDGKIKFLDDCQHELRGQTVELGEF